jgi:hypothetical protein
MKKMYVAFGILALLSLTAFGQDPLKVAPEAYKLEFENEWVKVTRVHYAAKSKIPAHDHTETGAAYVYLNDSGPVIFRHIGLNYGAITRPATKAGSFRLYRAVKEVHEVENQNDGPSDFLRIEFKTVSDAEKPLRGKFYREEYAAGENFEKVQFENEQVRATRLACAKACEVSAGAAAPVLIVGLTSIGNAPAGPTRWIAAGKKETISNAGSGHAEFLRFDFKSKPTTEKPNAHPHE